MKIKSQLAYLALIGLGLLATSIPVSSQSARSALVFDPPSNIRTTPNGNILCTIKARTTINVYNVSNGWYSTDACGGWGYIHQSQIRLQSSNTTQNPSVFCDVVNIQQGQLALRLSPNGRSRAGLNNGNTVRLIREQGIWFYVKVVQGPNSRVNGLEGWVNSNYLSCYDDF
jgi:hypothetical protein